MSTRLSGYSGLQITLHWAIAVLVLIQLIFGDAMSHAIRAANRGTQPTEADQLWADIHYYVGIALLALVIIRIIARWISGTPPVLERGLMRAAAYASHLLFYIVLILAPILGLLAFYFGDPFGDLHQLSKPVLIVLIAIHFMAALYHQLWLKDGTLRRIIVPAK